MCTCFLETQVLHHNALHNSASDYSSTNSKDGRTGMIETRARVVLKHNALYNSASDYSSTNSKDGGAGMLNARVQVVLKQCSRTMPCIIQRATRTRTRFKLHETKSNQCYIKLCYKLFVVVCEMSLIPFEQIVICLWFEILIVVIFILDKYNKTLQLVLSSSDKLRALHSLLTCQKLCFFNNFLY